ncbi:alpha/beta hydrolase [Marinomonas algarum]|uniref:Alpha/beta fold hydrolase n=1 Tax=Marinomonas algarum TaxID=2883105 RepID=A0A9X1LEV5_9GAMM|nr:alpha/beta fold hydrolase [Marinomonas algarum]MCB5162116.1 alpha/beta fold hydrolase [Marinomonas algarum]
MQKNTLRSGISLLVLPFLLVVSTWVIAQPSPSENGTVLVYKKGESFTQYRQRAHDYVFERKVWVNESNKQRELSAVLPFELLPDTEQCAEPAKAGVILSHGLSDSPFSMRDMAYALQAACYHVRVVLLPGHGTRAEDLLDVHREDWRATFRSAADQFGQEVDTLYVGGFSTGGALAVEYAWQHSDRVAGVVLFSPVFKVNSRIDWLAPWLALVKDWLDHRPSDDFAKYASIPVPAIAQVYRLAKEVRAELVDNPSDLPVFMALSEEDNTVDSSVSQTVFELGMIGDKSRMVLYSQTQNSQKNDRLTVQNTYWPEDNILGLSHMAIHGHPENPYYGAEGEYRLCGWHATNEERYQVCRKAKDNWFGEHSDALFDQGNHAARISWNPHFHALMQEITLFLQTNRYN